MRDSASRIVPSIHLPDGSVLEEAADMANAFADYYRSLYAAHERPCRESLSPLVTELPLPRLGDPDCTTLDLPLSMDEVEKALTELNAGRTPGPESVECGHFPPELDLATIVVLHKDGRPPTDCASYRPISLINSEIKLYTRVLANRLLRFLTFLIHPDQCGFMPRRST